MRVLSAHKLAYCMHTWGPEQPGVTGGCGPPCECYELKPGPLREPQALLVTESSLQTLNV